MILDNINAKIGVSCGFFWRFRVARHISRAKCSEISWDREGQAAYEIFSIKRRFRRSKSRFSKFKKTCARGIKERYPRKSRYFTVVGQSFVKTVADHHGHAAYHNKHYSNELFSRININDYERPWTPKIRGFITFAKEVMFLPVFVCLFVCLSVSKKTQKFMDGSLKFWGYVGHSTSYQWFNFGGDPKGILDSGSLWNFCYHCVKRGIREPLAKWIWWRHLANSFTLAEVPAGYDCFLVDFCDLRMQRTLQEWITSKWLEIDWQFANRNCYKLSRVSWALAHISCFFSVAVCSRHNYFAAYAT